MQSLWRNLVRRDADAEEETLLGGVPLFEDLSPREMDTVQRLLHRREYVAGEVIFHQGEPGLGMYIIAQGTVSIQSEPAGRELVQLSDGHFFGEIALLNEVIRTATARAKTDCTLLSLFQPDLLGLLDRTPKLGVKVLLALARLVGLRLVEVSDEMQETARERDALRARLAGAGLDEAALDAPETPGPART